MTTRLISASFKTLRGKTRAAPKKRKITPAPSSKSAGEEELYRQLCSVWHMGIEREKQFHPKRRWRFDFSIQALMVAIEIEGVTCYGNHLGRHQTHAGYSADCEKYNTALLMGWRVLRFTQGMVKDGTAIELVKVALGQQTLEEAEKKMALSRERKGEVRRKGRVLQPKSRADGA